jgi:hypothetical protein
MLAQVVVGIPTASAALLTSPAAAALSSTIVFDEADHMLAGVRTTGGKAEVTPCAQILRTMRPSNKGRAKASKAEAAKAEAATGGAAGGAAPRRKKSTISERDAKRRGVRVESDGPKATGAKAEAARAAAAKVAKEAAAKAKATKAAAKAAAAEDGEEWDEKVWEENGGAEAARATGEPPQVIFVSATVPGQRAGSVGAFISARFPDVQWIRSDGAHRPHARLTTEHVVVADAAERDAALVRLCREQRVRTLVVANSKRRALDASRALATDPDLAERSRELFHPDIPPEQREAALARFAASADGVLVCTGLANRGIDVPDIRLVVEYQMAPNLVEYVHRIGRTARAGREGRAVSLVAAASENEAAMLKEVERCRKGGWKYL